MKNKNTVIIIVGVVVVAGIIAAVALGGKKDSSMGNMKTSSSSSATTADAVATNSVKIQNFAFTPAAIKVKVGTKVTWTNSDSVHHTVTDDTGSKNGPNSKLLGQGESYSFTFSKAGTFNYHCTPHPYMKGTVVVSN